jgi:hypothetical protein
VNSRKRPKSSGLIVSEACSTVFQEFIYSQFHRPLIPLPSSPTPTSLTTQRNGTTSSFTTQLNLFPFSPLLNYSIIDTVWAHGQQRISHGAPSEYLFATHSALHLQSFLFPLPQPQPPRMSLLHSATKCYCISSFIGCIPGMGSSPTRLFPAVSRPEFLDSQFPPYLSLCHGISKSRWIQFYDYIIPSDVYMV